MADKKCAYLTMQDPGDFVMDYDLSFDAMAALGWHVDTVPWRNPDTDWDEYDAVYLRTDEQAAGRFAAAFDKHYCRRAFRPEQM